MASNPHTIKFTDEDWDLLKILAESEGITVGKLINQAAKDYAAERGVTLGGTNTHGDARRFQRMDDY